MKFVNSWQKFYCKIRNYFVVLSCCKICTYFSKHPNVGIDQGFNIIVGKTSSKRALSYKNFCCSTHPTRNLPSRYHKIEFFASYVGYAKEEGGIGWAAGGGGLLKGGMERGLEAESTSFSRYNRGECTVRKTSKKEKQGTGIERQEYVRAKGRGRREQKRLERSAGYEISYACLSVRLNLRAHQQPPTSKKNLAERRIPLRRDDGGKGRG